MKGIDKKGGGNGMMIWSRKLFCSSVCSLLVSRLRAFFHVTYKKGPTERRMQSMKKQNDRWVDGVVQTWN